MKLVLFFAAIWNIFVNKYITAVPLWLFVSFIVALLYKSCGGFPPQYLENIFYRYYYWQALLLLQFAVFKINLSKIKVPYFSTDRKIFE